MNKKAGELRSEIEELLNNLNLERANVLIEEYYRLFSEDLDLLSYKTIYELYSGNAEEALKSALKAVRRYPTNGEAYINLGSVYEELGNTALAIINLQRADSVFAVMGIEGDPYGLEDRLVVLWEKLEDQYNKTHDITLLNLIRDLIKWRETSFGTQDVNYRPLEKKKIVGSYLLTDLNKKIYVASYRVQSPELLEDSDFNAFQMKLELKQVTEGNKFKIGDKEEEYLLPIAVKESDTTHFFIQDRDPSGKRLEVLQKQKENFNYYRVKKGTELISSDISYYGTPIPLIHKKERKKLVLNIFVDGLSQFILENSEELMPYTYGFFKKGTICTSVYSSAEWTYPSIGTYNCGLYTPGHMMVHSLLNTSLPSEITTLAEYFHKAGYYTSKMDGDWRSTPNYGYYRGYDQIIYQNQHLGSKCETILGEVIDHIEAFRDTDQFLWFEMGDLHDVADNFDLTPAVQGNLPLSLRTMDTEGLTSVKQDYSLKKIETYKSMIKNVDNLLSLLYYYLETRYKEEEILVSLFADHGQGYIVRNEDFFISEGRTKIAYMFRGRGADAVRTDELMSNCDYIPIMCALAGIPINKDESIDGILPKAFGGKNEREYVISESIHPGDPYQAAVYAKEYTVYFVNGTPVRDDGRFELIDFRETIKNKSGEEIEDRELLEKYKKIILEHLAGLIIHQ